jgi:phosphonate metabolism protein PhnN/1,5-bisphosphokinase (PRPP-forming)
MTRGTLYLIVGPSGAGKDSLMRAAGEILADDRDFVFARRVITRPLDPERESHEPVDGQEFDRRKQAGDFMLSWWAYVSDYGIPARYDAMLAEGRHVIANISRTMVGYATAHFRPARVIQITAPPAVLEQRLMARGDVDAAKARLARNIALPDSISVHHVLNVRPLDSVAARLVTLLRELSSAH